MVVSLNKLATGTVFTFKGCQWKKIGTVRGNELKCVPMLGGQWQVELAEFIPNAVLVDVS